MDRQQLKSIHARLTLLLAAVNANLELEGAALDGAGEILFEVIREIESVSGESCQGGG